MNILIVGGAGYVGGAVTDLLLKNKHPTRKEDTKAEDQEASSALGTLGLKPKAVH